MSERWRYFCLALLLLSMGLSACSGEAAERVGDVTPLPVEVMAEATTAAPEEAQAPLEEAAGSTVQAEAPAQGSERPILTFSISGGVVGFCDELALNPGGTYLLRLCDGRELTGELGQADWVSLESWRENLSDINLTFEDNPGGADSLKTALTFDGQGEVEADERQQQVIYEWVNGLVVRLRPQQLQPTPTPAPVAVGAAGICPEVTRPALLTLNLENPNNLTLLNPETGATCPIPMSQPPAGRVVVAAGSLFYSVFDPAAKTLSVWQLNPAGEHLPLAFTSVPMGEPAPFDFIVSNDGAHIAWSQTNIDLESDPPVYRNSLWLAQTDGSNQVALLEDVENSEARFVSPARFSSGGATFYYALQPDLGGPLGGRYDNLYQVPVAGGTAELLYTCPTGENPVCIGGISPDGALLTVIQPAEGALQLLDRSGALVNSFPLPATDYIERTAFSPGGNLAFASAALTEGTEEAPPQPNPGYLSFAAPPYSEALQTLLEDNRISTLLGWLDETRLVVGLVDEEGKPITAVLTTGGQVSEASPDIVVAVWQ